MAKVELNKEQALYAIQTFLMFLNIAKVTDSQSGFDIQKYKDQVLQLLENLSSEQLDPSEAILQLNSLVKQVNQWLRAPYPIFLMDTSESLVKGKIVAFEHYLNQELKANHLTLQEESPLFNESLTLWDKVGVSLSAKEGVSELANLIEKLNRLLPHEEHYPIPDKN